MLVVDKNTFKSRSNQILKTQIQYFRKKDKQRKDMIYK